MPFLVIKFGTEAAQILGILRLFMGLASEALAGSLLVVEAATIPC